MEFPGVEVPCHSKYDFGVSKRVLRHATTTFCNLRKAILNWKQLHNRSRFCTALRAYALWDWTRAYGSEKGSSHATRAAHAQAFEEPPGSCLSRTTMAGNMSRPNCFSTSGRRGVERERGGGETSGRCTRAGRNLHFQRGRGRPLSHFSALLYINR